MASTVRLLAFALVGGGYTTDDVRCGLWCWTFDNTSSNTYTSYGARLLIFSGTWCGLHFPFVCVSLLLSAVLGLMVRKLGCGIGTSFGLGLITTLMSVLDYLYL